MFNTPEDFCPLIKSKCVKEKCKFYINVKGKHPQSQEVVDRYDCGIAWMPFLILEAAKETREQAASLDKLTNQSASIKEGLAHILNFFNRFNPQKLL